MIAILVTIGIFLSLAFSTAVFAKEKFLTFPKYSYGFTKPSDWELKNTSQEGCGLRLSNVVEDKHFPLFIQIRAAYCPISNLDEYVAQLIPANKKALLDGLMQVNDVKESSVLLGSYVAKEVIFIGEGATGIKSETKTGKDAVTLSIDSINVPVIFKNVITIKNGIVYVLEYGGREEEFKKHEKDFNDVVTSFVINKKIKERAEATMNKFQSFMDAHPLQANTKEN